MFCLHFDIINQGGSAMVFGVSTACFFPKVLLEDSIDILGSMQIKNIEVFFNCMSEYKMPFVKELKKRADGNGLNVYSIHAFSIQFEPQLFTLQQRARQEAEDIYKQVIEAAAELGAGVYVFHGPPNLKRAKKNKLNYEHIANTIGPLADIAKAHGVKMAWENVHWCWYAEPDFADNLLKLPGTENLYFTLDIKQAALAGFAPGQYLKPTAGKLANVHICDCAYSEERGGVPALPFKGCIDFDSFKRELDSTGYNGGMILEVYANNYSDICELKENYSQVRSFFLK
jgi:sugar phosphate isomerase/epimerase